MKIAIVLNEQRVPPALAETLKSNVLVEKYAINYDLYLTPPAELNNVLNTLNLQSYNALIIGGGDGTVRTAVQILMDKALPLCILPLGTFNVLATSLDYPNDIDALFSIIKNNKTKQIDIAEVNGQIVINHAWIGFYYYILKLREKHKEVLGKNKLFKIIFNTVTLFKLLPIYHLELVANEHFVAYKTCLLYVGNNDSHTGLLDFGERKSLTSGLLAVTILNCHTRWQLFKCLLQIIFGDIKNSKYVTQILTDNLVITSKSKLINIVIDGELFKLDSPLKFINHQKKLTVIVP